MQDSFKARGVLRVGAREYEMFRLQALQDAGMDVSRLPYSLRILLENLLRHEDGVTVTREDITALAQWDPSAPSDREIAFTPARVVLQDFTGVPCLVDLAAMRDAMAALGGDPGAINPLQPVELVIDHSVQVDAFGTPQAFGQNVELDYARNAERYAFLRWGQQAFDNFKVVPPNTGIVHQVNLEHLARVVFTTGDGAGAAAPARTQAYPDTCVGTDSHTPMVNGLGVLAWGVGGIEAEAAMLGQPISMLIPQVIGFRLEGALPEGATATDLVLTVTELLRKKGVVGKFVEFFGPGVASLSLADRATIGNMSPEYGATCAIFPPDEVTLQYLRLTGRGEERIALVEAYMKEQGLFQTSASPQRVFTDTVTLDLSTVRPSVAGPGRPQDRVVLTELKQAFHHALPTLLPASGGQARTQKAQEAGAASTRGEGVWGEGSGGTDGFDASRTAQEVSDRSPSGAANAIDHGSVVIAAITSCTNTSNPSVMIAAGLLAKKAVERGLARKPWVKSSLAPGSLVVTEYFRRAGLERYLDALGFHTVGYGCTTCIGNSGPLPSAIAAAIEERGLVACSVLSGNRNFEGRINSEVRANYLMSPPLVIAFALAGRIDWDPTNEPLGTDPQGRPVFLADLWPTAREIEETIHSSIDAAMYASSYSSVFEGDARWKSMDIPAGNRYAWSHDSTYVRRPPYFDGMSKEPPASVDEVRGARVVGIFGDSVTTDHISPAGTIARSSPAGRFLLEQGVAHTEFNSYGSRRGNHEVMVRGTFANGRIRNALAGGREGGWTTHLPSGEVLSIYDAAMRYQQEGTPLAVLAGKEYGSGSSRDWAAKGPYLQGIKLVIAQSYERIHRSNLVGMGILPLQFVDGESVQALGLSGRETLETIGLSQAIATGFAGGRTIRVRATDEAGATREFEALVRVDTPQEVLYLRHGGILQFVLRQLLGKGEAPKAVAPAPATPVPAASSAEDAQDAQDAVDEGSIESFPASDPPAH
ncbi:aconitate hydratase AcnA [Ramlibacter sp. AN1015]|uniref:aconitate hydratase AcnA n=1 Tax=Ramlibacter sp. AN1015 TaxID=3133428 RepID=UPI0030C3A414